MFYIKYDHKSIPYQLKQNLIQAAYTQAGTGPEYNNYGWFNTTDKDDLSYIPSIEMFEQKYGNSGDVSFLQIPDDLLDELTKFYGDNPFFTNGYFALQLNYNINTFPPHIDVHRSITRMYILQQGGDNAVTSWFSPLDEFKHLEYNYPVNFIDYDRLSRVHSTVLDADCWYDLTVSKIHGVENLTDHRISIVFVMPSQ